MPTPSPAPQNPPPSPRKGLPGPLFFLALILAASPPSCKKSTPPAPPPPIVEVATLTTCAVPMQTELIGQLDSPQNVEVRARVEGFVAKILFTEGMPVKKGDPLFELDKKPFIEKLAAANGALEEAKAALAKSEKDVERLTPLAERKAIPQQDLDNARAAVDVSKAGIATAQARVESATLDLGYCDIAAPLDGLIGAKQVSVGELVGKGEPTLLATMSTLDPIWFYTNLSEVDFLQAEERSQRFGKKMDDLELTLLLSNRTEHSAKGKFVFIDRAVNVQTGTLRIRAEFPNPAQILRPGMFARIRIELGTRQNCLTVPERALVELQGKTFVWVVTENNTATQREVTKGEKIGPNHIIDSGLNPGDRIIIEGIQKVREGTTVNAMTTEQLAALKAQANGQSSPQ